MADRLQWKVDYTPISIFYSDSSQADERRYSRIVIESPDMMLSVGGPDGEDYIQRDREYRVLQVTDGPDPIPLTAKLLEGTIDEAKALSISQPKVSADHRYEPEYLAESRDLSEGLSILLVIQGEYGTRILDRLKGSSPPSWRLESITIPDELPEIIDDPSPFLPSDIPSADLVLFLSESPQAPQLIPEVVKSSEAVALIAPVDRTEWMPPGQVTQVKRTMVRWKVDTAFPRPFCSLEPIGSKAIDLFAERFGRPSLEIHTDDGKTVSRVVIRRGAPCGCTDFVATNLEGVSFEEAVEKAGLLHHHYPCLASMDREDDIDDTLMHLSGLILKREVDERLKPHHKKKVSYLDPKQFKR